MNLSQRTKLSLCQFLTSLLSRDELILLLQKHGIPHENIEFAHPGGISSIKETLLGAEHTKLGALIQELARTRGAIRTGVSPKYKFDERWSDLCRCLELDGYAVARDENGRKLDRFHPIEPVIPGVSNPEDELRNELERSGLAGADQTVSTLDKSASAFRNEDFNGCLSNARVGLQALATTIAKACPTDPPHGYDESKWGQVLARLKSTNLITDREEKALAGVYGFISDGTHKPVGFTEQEFARLGRTLALNFCYFLVKRWNANCS
jgi:hypothetical protein